VGVSARLAACEKEGRCAILESFVTQARKTQKRNAPRSSENSAIQRFEIARGPTTLEACQTRRDPAPKEAKR